MPLIKTTARNGGGVPDVMKKAIGIVEKLTQEEQEGKETTPMQPSALALADDPHAAIHQVLDDIYELHEAAPPPSPRWPTNGLCAHRWPICCFS